MLFRFLFGTAGRHRTLQAVQHRGPCALGDHGLRLGAAPAVQVQKRVQLHQTGGLYPQIILIRERLAHFLLGGGLLLV